MADTTAVRDQARKAALELATERLPVFLKTSPLEVLVGIAVAALGVLTGGLTGSALVGLGVLLVAWTLATGIASARTAATLKDAEAERLDALAQRLLIVDEQLAGSAAAPHDEVRAALLDQGRRSLELALADLGVRREPEPATEQPPPPIGLVPPPDTSEAPAPIRSLPDNGAAP